jgi:hypothetical protein
MHARPDTRLRFLQRAAAFAFLALTALFTAACASILGDDYTIQKCSDETTCTGCTSCSLTATCKSQSDDCSANIECSIAKSCFNSCGSGPDAQPCIQSCVQDFPAGANSYQSLVNCECNACSKVCTGCG